jgi:hypothetical protein
VAPFLDGLGTPSLSSGEPACRKYWNGFSLLRGRPEFFVFGQKLGVHGPELWVWRAFEQRQEKGEVCVPARRVIGEFCPFLVAPRSVREDKQHLLTLRRQLEGHFRILAAKRIDE